MFRRENPKSEPAGRALPATTVGAAKQQRGWHANEPQYELRSVWGAHRRAKIVVFVIVMLACVGAAVYAFRSMLG